jgi:hypothetical protein
MPPVTSWWRDANPRRHAQDFAAALAKASNYVPGQFGLGRLREMRL